MRKYYLIRHAHRLPFAPRDWGNEVSITEKGLNEALNWGQQHTLKEGAVIVSSPVKRCVQTANAIKCACSVVSPVLFSPLLGDPGSYISDPEAVGPIFKNYSIVSIMQMIVQKEKNRGFFSFKEGSARMLQAVIFQEQDVVSVSHDMNVALVVCFLFGLSPTKSLLPDFLEGIAFTFANGRITIAYRNFKIITEETSFREMVESHLRFASANSV